MECGGILLHALGARFSVDERFENGEYVAAVINHAGEDVAQRGVVLGFAMPLQQYRGRDLDIPAKLFGGMPAQEQPIKESRLALREVEVVLGFVRRVGDSQQGRVGYSLHQRPETEREVYRKFSRRQVVQLKM